GSSTIDIAKANAGINITPYTGTYDAQAHALSGSATGIGGVDLDSQLTLGASVTNAGHYDIAWFFAGGGNYQDASGSSSIDIAKANAVVVVNGSTGTYDG